MTSNIKSEVDRVMQNIDKYVRDFGWDAQEVATRQGGLLMRDCVESMPPMNKEKAVKEMTKSVLSVVAAPRITFPDEKPQGKELIWLNAGPNFLTGVSRSDHYASNPQASFDLKKGKMGRKYVPLGKRGKQHVQRLNRIVVRKNELREFTKKQIKRIGKMKASFAVNWDQFGPKGKRPANWIMDHVTDGTARGSAFVSGSPNVAGFTIVSNATGVEGQAAKRAALTALNNRVEKIKIDIANIVKYGPGKRRV